MEVSSYCNSTILFGGIKDNGKEFTLNNHKGNEKLNLTGAFDFICEAYEIDHRTTRSYTPQTNGMVENLLNNVFGLKYIKRALNRV